jgi:MYXO-CTERM domain-containing protein
MLLIMDTSGSMDWGNPTRMSYAKAALANVVNASGEAIWGLQRFAQDCTAPCNCNGSCAGEQPLVPLDPDRQDDILVWVDGVCDFAGTPANNPELEPDGPTPLGASLVEALTYYQNNVFGIDPFEGCRPYFVILLTDGQETCGGNPAAEAANLYTAGVETLVIGFGVAAPNAQLDAIAAAGASDLAATAVYVELDDIELALALMNIIVDSVLVEVCNGEDDDCDGDIDEGFALGVPCDNGMTGACYREGVTVCRSDELGVECGAGPVTPPEDPEVTCDGSDNDCDCPGDTNGDGCVCCAGDFNVDEGLTNACGTCGAPPEEVCDWLDNDCNGLVDDASGVGEICAHPDAPGPVGDEGECELGTMQCQGVGPLQCIGAVGPEPEICDCLDNDCDGETDEPPGAGEPDLCPPGSECIDCFCVSDCASGEFPCPPGYICDTNNQCIPDECTQARCPPGTFCAFSDFCQGAACTGTGDCDGACAADEHCLLADGTCHEKPCLDLCSLCQPGQVCIDGVCIDDDCYYFPEQCDTGEICLDASCIPDACAGVECTDTQFCRLGECFESCAFVYCPDQLCVDGECLPDPCVEDPCGSGEVCDDGTCVADPCSGVICGAGRVCRDGECVDDLCRYIRCPEGAVCENDQCVAAGERTWVEETGCGCQAGSSGSTGFLLFLGLVILGLGLRRRFFRPGNLLIAAGVLAMAGAAGAGCKTTMECTDCRDCVVTNDGSELCDNMDNDCDCPGDTNGDGWFCGPGDEGVDEDFDLMTDLANCGSCGNACRIENAYATCENGACVLESCIAGFLDANGDIADGCEYSCIPTNGGVEICDAVDNDCDCTGDTNGDGCFCCSGDDNVDEAEDIPSLGLDCGSDTGECEMGVTTCVDGVIECVGEIRPSVELCDGLDNDCNGAVDELFGTLGQPCFAGEGACELEGAFSCDASGTGVWCGCTQIIGGGTCDATGDEIPVDGNATASASEIWNNIDDDCNTLVDDGIPTTEAMVHIAYNHWEYGPVDFWIYTYEASRPDASANNAGIVESLPQSVPGVLPWTMTTWDGANAACLAAGKRLCTEEEWQAACESDETRVWPYGLLDTDYVPDYCNDNAYDFDPGTPEDDDGLLPTGDSTSCVTKDGIFDMSGNVKEWTSTLVTVAPDPEAWRIRGGGFDSPAAGTRCDFNFSAGTDTYVFGNLGFRCCSDTAP